nr:MAG TPA: hypothetical protein [Crassvirales sp.]
MTISPHHIVCPSNHIVSTSNYMVRTKMYKSLNISLLHN